MSRPYLTVEADEALMRAIREDHEGYLQAFPDVVDGGMQLIAYLAVGISGLLVGIVIGLAIGAL